MREPNFDSSQLPKATNGRRLSYATEFTDEGELEFFVDPKHPGKHACIYEEYALVWHVRCKHCGHCRKRKEVPFYKDTADEF